MEGLKSISVVEGFATAAVRLFAFVLAEDSDLDEEFGVRRVDVGGDGGDSNECLGELVKELGGGKLSCPDLDRASRLCFSFKAR